MSCTPLPAPWRHNDIEGLLVIGGWSAYEAAYKLYTERDTFPAFNIPIICLPATIDNNLPGSELSIGADTALNSIVEVVDKIKQSAVANRRCFVVEVMGHYCGYLALMSGLATGAERVYLNEEGVTLSDLEADLNQMIDDFQKGKRLSLLIRNEHANPLYTTDFMCALFEEESQKLFDVRTGHPGPHAAGRQPFALRPHPGHPPGDALRRVPERRSRKTLIHRRLHRHPGRPYQDPSTWRTCRAWSTRLTSARRSSGGWSCGRWCVCYLSRRNHLTLMLISCIVNFIGCNSIL